MKGWAAIGVPKWKALSFNAVQLWLWRFHSLALIEAQCWRCRFPFHCKAGQNSAVTSSSVSFNYLISFCNATERVWVAWVFFLQAEAVSSMQCVCLGFPSLRSAFGFSEVWKDELWLHRWLRCEHGAGAGSGLGAACGSLQIVRKCGMGLDTMLASLSWMTIFLVRAACDVSEHLMGPPVRGWSYWKDIKLWIIYTNLLWSIACIFNEGWLHFINRPLKIKIILISFHLAL